MAYAVIAEWEGREREHNPRSADWYWVVGIVSGACAVAAIIFGNYLFAIVIIMAAVALALHATIEPPVHRFRLVEQGLVIGEDLYPFSSMTSFAILEDVDGEMEPILSIKTDSWVAPHLEVPLEGVDADLVYDRFLGAVEEDEHHPILSDVVAAWLGF